MKVERRECTDDNHPQATGDASFSECEPLDTRHDMTVYIIYIRPVLPYLHRQLIAQCQISKWTWVATSHTQKQNFITLPLSTLI